MLKVKIILINLLWVGILLTSCYKDVGERDTSEIWDVYLPYSITTDIPVDLNFDGIANTDLSKELPVKSNSIYIEQTDLNPVIDINWVEPEFDKKIYLKKLPDTLGETTTIRYLPAARQYYFHDSFSTKGRAIIPGTRLVNNYTVFYTFVFPDSILLNGDELHFSTKQDVFVSRWSHKQISIFAVFKKEESISR